MYQRSPVAQYLVAIFALLISGSIASDAFAATATITANFGSRAATSYPIPANMFGAGLGGQLQPALLPLMKEGGLTYTRFHAVMQNTYQTTTPNWTALDAELTQLQAAGIHVILEMDYTPVSLQPIPNPCPIGTNAVHAPPTIPATLAAMATAYVRHIDRYFPGVVTDYEIWNEPDGGGLCAADGAQATKLAEYLAIFSAVAPAIHNAAAKDGLVVRTGGPALGSTIADAPLWISTLLGSKKTAQYIDFVSFHYYPSGANDVAKGLTWDGSNGTPSLYAMTQSPKSIGFANVYKEVAALVKKGLQPNASKTPIYLDEYNSDWAFASDCCRNSQTYAPVWNAMVYVDLLNSVYSGAFEVPSKILYYAVSNPPFCIAGIYDADMDCAYILAAASTPYPQYYALQLFASTSYLGLQNGGYMTASAPTSTNPLLATSFWTNAGDSIVIVNPTSTGYSSVSVTANNPNIASAHGTVDFIDSSNRAITTQSVSLVAAGTGYSATISVPAYSVVALTITK